VVLLRVGGAPRGETGVFCMVVLVVCSFILVDVWISGTVLDVVSAAVTSVVVTSYDMLIFRKSSLKKVLVVPGM